MKRKQRGKNKKKNKKTKQTQESQNLLTRKWQSKSMNMKMEK